MHLKKLLLSGFKSFVNVTDVRFPSHLIGLVGPNGCGKSNVIDAVRWVMGESSAKMLRGDSMVDVIFNGSAARKPVGQASVELIFDNSSHKIGGKVQGNYGQFAEIAIKRTLNRDGQSTYRINNLKTRRKDVLDLFRDAGMGPRSYSLIEQGMVSRIVEARPEELRVFVEEAAGTAKYKDRRRETETKMARTRDNLARVADIRDELAKQLRRLQRQSAAAHRYKLLKAQERELTGELYVLKLNDLDQQLTAQARLTAGCEQRHEAALAELTAKELELENLRSTQTESSERNSVIQQEYYEVSANISNVEQSIQHQKESSQRQSAELARLEGEVQGRLNLIETDQQKRELLMQTLQAMLPELTRLEQVRADEESKLVAAEQALNSLLKAMEVFNEQAVKPAQEVEIQKSRMLYLEQNQAKTAVQESTLRARLDSLTTLESQQDISSLSRSVEDHDTQYDRAEAAVHATEEKIKTANDELDELKSALALLENQHQQAVSRLNSLQEIQQAILGGEDDALHAWLVKNHLDGKSKLAAEIAVAQGWEAAVDRVLNQQLSAVLASNLDAIQLEDLPDSELNVVGRSDVGDVSHRHDSLEKLASKITAGKEWVEGLLTGIFVADNLHQALLARKLLSGNQILVTPQAQIVGATWLSIPSLAQTTTGVLVREEEISQLSARQQQLEQPIAEYKAKINARLEQPDQLAQALSLQKKQLIDLRAQGSVLHNRYGNMQARCKQTEDQIVKLGEELNSVAAELLSGKNELDRAQTLLAAAKIDSGTMEQKKQALIIKRDELSKQVAAMKQLVSAARENHHQQALAKEKLEAEISATRENLNRLMGDRDQAGESIQRLAQDRSAPGDKIERLQSELEILLSRKLSVDDRFSLVKDEAESFNHQIEVAKTEKQHRDESVNLVREELDQQRILNATTSARRETLLDSIREHGFSVEECRAELPADVNNAGEVNQETWQQKLQETQAKIDRIGPVNLVAIVEFDEQSKRMEYLDKQHADLSEALDNLLLIIKKIDRETRSRFKDTFDKINAGFNEFFPKLFAGGSAALHLTSDDLLTAGVTVMARPPGKRNSHIHLLSGGEKALTAVAILFAIFQLNPAPFCMMDEVDAPLDDANVERYCETLKTLATKSQIIVITHNKITMAAMDLLVGVTMAEAGVSRLVSVDIDQALEMVAQ